MDDERTEADAAADGAGADAAATGADAGGADAEASGTGAEVSGIEAEAEAAIVDLPWDEDLPVALGDDSDATEDGPGLAAEDALDEPDGPDPDLDGDELLAAYDEAATARRNALPRRVESWRTRSASGAIATAIAMGLQQVFEPERRRPAAVAEAPSDPYHDDDPVTVDYVPDDAESTRVHVKPWLLQKGDPT